MHRIITTADNDQQRQIEYNSRSAAFAHFRAIALSPHIHTVVLQKAQEGEMEDDWTTIARVEIVA